MVQKHSKAIKESFHIYIIWFDSFENILFCVLKQMHTIVLLHYPMRHVYNIVPLLLSQNVTIFFSMGVNACVSLKWNSPVIWSYFGPENSHFHFLEMRDQWWVPCLFHSWISYWPRTWALCVHSKDDGQKHLLSSSAEIKGHIRNLYMDPGYSTSCPSLNTVKET